MSGPIPAEQSRYIKLLPWLVLFASIGITYHFWKIERDETVQRIQSDFDFTVRESAEHIQQRLLAYEQVLRGAGGLFAVSSHVKRDEFRTYVEKLHLGDNYSGIQGVGFSLLVPPELKEKHIATIRKEISRTDIPPYSIKPEGKRSIYTSIIYLEPFSGRNLRAFGYDMFSEPVRRNAMERARDSGKTSCSGKVTLVQEIGKDVQLGFLMYLPVYKNGAPHDTVAERRANIIGWVYSPFRMGDLMQGILDQRSAELDYEIYDGDEVSENNLMYDSDNRTNNPVNAHFRTTQRFNLAGHHWTLFVRSYPSFEKRLDTHRAEIIVQSGIVGGLLLTLLTWSLVSGQRRAYSYAQAMNRELFLSEQRWKFALEGAGEGIWERDLETGKIIVSPRFEEILGYDEGEYGNSGAMFWNSIHPEDRPHASEELRDYLDSKKLSYSCEFRLLCKDGQYKWVLSRGMLTQQDSDGKRLRLIGTLNDISVRKQTENELRKENEKVNALLRNASDGIYILNLQGEVVEASDSFCEMLGYRRDEIVGMNVTQWEAKTVATNLLLLIRNQYEQHKRIEFETLHRRKDGSIFDAEVSGFSLELNGNPVMFYSSRDISKRKELEKALRENELRYRTVADYTSDWEYWIMPDNTFQYVSPSCEQISGYSPEEFFADPQLLTNIIHPDDLHLYVGHVHKITERGFSEPIDFRIRMKTGEIHWISHVCRPVFDTDGNHIGQRASNRDIHDRKLTEELLRKSSEEIEDLYNHAPCGYHSLDKDGVIQRINDTELQWLGYTREEVVGKLKMSDLLATADRQSFQKNFLLFKKRGFVRDFENEIVRKDGSVLYGLGNSTIIVDADNEYVSSRSTMFDITERKKTEDTLRSLFVALEHSPIAVIIADSDANILYANHRFTEISGYPVSDVIGSNLRILQAGRLEKYTYLEMWNALTEGKSWHGEMLNKSKQGRVYWEDVQISPVKTPNGETSNYVVVSADISERKSTEEKMRHLATYDPLTDLPNRSLVNDRIRQALTAAKRDKTNLALMFLDLDRFKPVNDTLGHHVGDLLLIEAAKRMQDCVRESDTVGRIGGDEFVVLLPTVDSGQDAMLVAEKIRYALNQPFVLAGNDLHISSSIGLALYPEHGDDAETLVKYADTAMYYAKEGGRNNVQLFRTEMLEGAK